MEQSLGEIFETYFKKRTNRAKRREGIRKYYRGKKTNFSRIKAKKGYIRFKIPGTSRYILLRQTAEQRMAKRRTGKMLGKATYLRRKGPRRRRYY